jgi:hypothetical protein
MLRSTCARRSEHCFLQMAIRSILRHRVKLGEFFWNMPISRFPTKTQFLHVQKVLANNHIKNCLSRFALQGGPQKTGHFKKCLMPEKIETFLKKFKIFFKCPIFCAPPCTRWKQKSASKKLFWVKMLVIFYKHSNRRIWFLPLSRSFCVKNTMRKKFLENKCTTDVKYAIFDKICKFWYIWVCGS